MTHSDGVAVVAVRGEIDFNTAPQLQESVERACELGVPVVLDMELVTFMDSAGLAAIIDAAGVAEGLSCAFQIKHPSERVRRVLTLTGLDGVFRAAP